MTVLSGATSVLDGGTSVLTVDTSVLAGKNSVLAGGTLVLAGEAPIHTLGVEVSALAEVHVASISMTGVLSSIGATEFNTFISCVFSAPNSACSEYSDCETGSLTPPSLSLSSVSLSHSPAGPITDNTGP